MYFMQDPDEFRKSVDTILEDSNGPAALDLVKALMTTEVRHGVVSQFKDIIDIIEFGKQKYNHDDILSTINTDLKNNHASMSRHLAQGFCQIPEDEESGKHPFAHLATRALVSLWRFKNGTYVSH